MNRATIKVPELAIANGLKRSQYLLEENLVSATVRARAVSRGYTLDDGLCHERVTDLVRNAPRPWSDCRGGKRPAICVFELVTIASYLWCMARKSNRKFGSIVAG
ncbi:hypothetical protein SBC1_74800 (plasmid) [Caballeronia sp. SBC1]|nr:hypothetical protein SBC2_71490 [Caballeronia sp. SBC2]QIN67433.1 hypothetical protein SBC1_74800 [Caballeronia sp. SBC1]